MLFRNPARPGAQDVASRALCLGLISLRAEMEQNVHGGAPMEVRDRCREISGRILGWARNEGVFRKGSSHECRILEIPFGEWTVKDISATINRTEAASMMLWALNRLQLRALPSPADRNAVLERLKVGEPSKDFVNFSALRNPAEIDQAKHAAAIWHWRARAQAWLRHPERVRPGADLNGAIRAAAMTAFTKGYAPQSIDGDFPAFGKPYREMSEEQLGAANTAAHERHHALNWLTAQHSDWDQISTETDGLFRI